MQFSEIINSPEKKKRFIIIISIFIFILSLTIFIIIKQSPFKLLFSNQEKTDYKKNIQKMDKKSNVILVQTSLAKNIDVSVYLFALGTVTPSESVIVKAQISGKLLKVLFKEGQIVKEGDLLAEIDSRPLKAQFEQFEGQLFKDQALLANARLDLKRYKILFPSGGVSKQTLDTQSSLVKQYEGVVQSDKGLLESIKVNLNYCKITSPISGKAGLIQINPGNYVQVSDPNGIVFINKLQPISVIFSIPEDYLPKIIEKTKNQFKLPTYAYNRENTDLLSTGELLTTDNQIDVATGTIKLKAQFKNENYTLFPNQFVNIKLLIETIPEALVIPVSAVQHGKNGDYVFLKEENKAKFQKVTTGSIDGDYIVIKNGLKTNDQVITDGLDKLTDGIEVTSQ